MVFMKFFSKTKNGQVMNKQTKQTMTFEPLDQKILKSGI
jgi:hypothetical protein